MVDSTTIGIYSIQNKKNGKIYVESSINVEKRIDFHKKALQQNRHPNKKLQKAWNKYGETAFVFKLLKEVKKEDLPLCEQKWINAHRTCTCKYSILPVAGRRLGYKHSIETRKKMSLSKLGKKRSHFNHFWDKMPEDLKPKIKNFVLRWRKQYGLQNEKDTRMPVIEDNSE